MCGRGWQGKGDLELLLWTFSETVIDFQDNEWQRFAYVNAIDYGKVFTRVRAKLKVPF